MTWLTENWTFLLLLAGVIVFMRFAGMGCAFGDRRSHPAHGPRQQQGGEDGPGGPSPSTDPVSQRTVDLKTAVATVYRGRAYYFESRENRDRFEAAPQTYAAPASEKPDGQGHGDPRGGCC